VDAQSRSSGESKMGRKPPLSIDLLRGSRIGLVLCGGGFKGAYQVGAWKALRELGFDRFTAVAGTSVGALNAVLIANGDVETAETVWKYKGFLRWSPRLLRKYLTAYTLLFGPFLIPLLFLLVALLLPSLMPAREAFEPRPDELSWLGVLTADALISCALAAFMVSFFLRDSTLSRRILFIIPVDLLAALGFLYCFISAAGIIGSISYYPVRVSLVSLCAGIALGITCCKFGISYLFSAYRSSSLFSNADVLEELDARINLEAIGRSVESLFVTLTRGVTFFDPFSNATRVAINPNPLFEDRRPGAINFELDPDTPGQRTEWVPDYVDLCGIDSKEQALETLRLTSAIPFAFTMGVTPKEEITADGGLVDNMPILPLLDKQLDYIVVMALDTRYLKTRAKLQEYVDRIWDKWWHTHSGDELILEIFGARMHGKDYRSLIPRTPEISPGRVIMIVPERPLPTVNLPLLRFLTGTLNLRLRTRQLWFEMGYEQTKRLGNMHVLD
jgi:predicted acylesterase/phospholipase RssA